MAPRAYRMTRRAAANAETRRRIVDAAITLHAEKGVLGTSWPDIAKRADVALGTVYRHFPSLDQLVPARTSEARLRTTPPAPGKPRRPGPPAERAGPERPRGTPIPGGTRRQASIQTGKGRVCRAE